MQAIEANIIYRIAKGDENALDAFMDFYSSHLYRIAFRVTGNKETAEEIVSDVFFNVWEQRRKLLEIENLPGYLRNTTYRMSLTRYRHDDTRDFSSLSIDDIEEFHHFPVVSPDEEYVSKEEVESINRAIEELPPKCRHVFTMAKLEKVSYKEISTLLDISLPTINYHVKTAVDYLKKRLLKSKPPD